MDLQRRSLFDRQDEEVFHRMTVLVGRIEETNRTNVYPLFPGNENEADDLIREEEGEVEIARVEVLIQAKKAMVFAVLEALDTAVDFQVTSILGKIGNSVWETARVTPDPDPNGLVVDMEDIATDVMAEIYENIVPENTGNRLYYTTAFDHDTGETRVYPFFPDGEYTGSDELQVEVTEVSLTPGEKKALAVLFQLDELSGSAITYIMRALAEKVWETSKNTPYPGELEETEGSE